MLALKPPSISFDKVLPCKKTHHRSPTPLLRSRRTAVAAAASGGGAATVAVVDSPTRVEILSEALPYIQQFRGKTIVVKYGGAAMKSLELQDSVVKDLVLLSCVGLRLVVIHGGGPEINSWLTRLNIQPQFLNGLRVTDAATMEISLVSLINRAGGTAVGLSGKDGRLLAPRPAPNSAGLGFVADVARVDPTILLPILSSGHIPVIASVAADEAGQGYNINADTVAGEIAAAVGAEKLILLTDVPGILEDRNDVASLVKEIDIKGVRKMVTCCVRSLAQGVRTASIIDGRKPHSLLLELLTGDGAGTMITG
ncbi:unnamed protein product [Spirodela intermedia]|uniref:acetylglutamate kinase n=1 Tax=Spirodela intermedia TaxID=51605 RepID=A0A7I8JUY1_SPIIN|nr:unnamed protein product [Spirodela intermedia]CAA6673565.1 unnamed protein product [Spirodela intermedia]